MSLDTAHHEHPDQASATGPDVDPEKVQEFASILFGALAAGSTALMVSLGHRTGLFDALAGLPPSTSPQVAGRGGAARALRTRVAAHDDHRAGGGARPHG